MLRLHTSILAVTLVSISPWSLAADLRDIQMRRLLEPTPAEIEAEKDGRIYIYESLTGSDIEKAMTEEFGRVESMMFIRVPKTDASGEPERDEQTGEVIYEDDGC